MTTNDDDERRIEREIRRQRRGDLAGALAGSDGGDHLRGASPTPVLQRALLEIEHWLDAHLDDPDGALQTVMLRRLAARPEAIVAGLGEPAATVGAWLDGILARPALMVDLVHAVDMEWGWRYDERPRFEIDGRSPHPDDPYTVAGVTALLTALRRLCPDS